jgi:hypothetical protein
LCFKLFGWLFTSSNCKRHYRSFWRLVMISFFLNYDLNHYFFVLFIYFPYIFLIFLIIISIYNWIIILWDLNYFPSIYVSSSKFEDRLTKSC